MVVIREELKAGNAQQSTRQRIELALGVMLRLMRQFLGAGWQPRRVCFEHSGAARPECAPAAVRPWRRVRLRLQLHRLREGRSRCAQPVGRSGDGALRAAVAGRVGPAAERRTMLEDVRRTILLLLPSGRCTIEQVAEHLGVVCRTLQRRLADRGAELFVDGERHPQGTRHATCHRERSSVDRGGDAARLFRAERILALVPRAIRLQRQGEPGRARQPCTVRQRASLPRLCVQTRRARSAPIRSLS